MLKEHCPNCDTLLYSAWWCNNCRLFINDCQLEAQYKRIRKFQESQWKYDLIIWGVLAVFLTIMIIMFGGHK